mmetsp:Transcript_56354/g.180932  ORF Transcript_56354/g.180932 Transcript_56354/m.180932 type:complete len:315 (+) Transcript_56354:1110-2054(+)
MVPSRLAWTAAGCASRGAAALAAAVASARLVASRAVASSEVASCARLSARAALALSARRRAARPTHSLALCCSSASRSSSCVPRSSRACRRRSRSRPPEAWAARSRSRASSAKLRAKAASLPWRSCSPLALSLPSSPCSASATLPSLARAASTPRQCSAAEPPGCPDARRLGASHDSRPSSRDQEGSGGQGTGDALESLSDGGGPDSGSGAGTWSSWPIPAPLSYHGTSCDRRSVSASVTSVWNCARDTSASSDVPSPCRNAVRWWGAGPTSGASRLSLAAPLARPPSPARSKRIRRTTAAPRNWPPARARHSS